MQGKNKSLYAYLVCALLIVYAVTIFTPKWERKAGETSFGWDACTYYWYLPATFIYKDLKQQKFGDSIIAKYDFTPEFEQSYVHESGNRVITYSSGLAFMHLPAFVVAHIIAKPLGYPPDGFSKPYQVCVQLWSMLAALIGLWYFRKLLLHYFSDQTVAITLLLLVFGTNYLNYTGFDVALTHSWLFSIYTLLLLNTRSFYLNPSYKYAIKIGLLCGFAALIRPSDIVIVLLPLLWGMEGIRPKAIREKFKFLFANYRFLAVAAVLMVLVGSVQIFYWLYVTGQPFVYSYADKGFSWKRPHFYNYTFSYRSGWLVYTPLMMFAFIGLFAFVRKGKNKIAIISFFLINYYIVAAWDVWWYGGMGGRAMVQSYAVLFFIIATVIESLHNTKWLKWLVCAVMIVFSYVNIWFTYNAHAKGGLYDPIGMTKAYYWAVVGRFNVPYETRKLKDLDELFKGKPRNLILIYRNGFESDTTETSIRPISGKRSVSFNLNRAYSPTNRFHYQPGRADWIRAKAKVMISKEEVENWKMLQYVINFNEGSRIVKNRFIRVNRLVRPEMVTDVYFDVRIPEQNFDSIEVFFWNPGSDKPTMVDDVEIWSFDE